MRHPTVIALAGALSLLPAASSAFCGFYVGSADAPLQNHATTVALMREGSRTVLSMRNDYHGPPANFAMVIPVPVVLQRDQVKTLPREIFDRLDRLAAPRLVEYWEQDPCAPDRGDGTGLGSIGTIGRGTGAGYGSGGGGGVRVEAQFAVGEYEVVILSASDSAGLDAWLRRERYQIPEGAGAVLDPYVRAGMKFFVARVDVSKVRFEGGHATLSPLRFHYDSPQFELPVRLGMINSPGTQDLVVHVLARGQRYEAANRPNTTVPTNLDVADEVRGDFGRFYAALFDRTMERQAGAVVTEYAWMSSTCDPCPVNPLSPSELATLGADALPSMTDNAQADAGANAEGVVRFAPPTVAGALPAEVVRRVMLRNLGQLRFCYDSALAGGTRIAGSALFRFTIGPTGAVTEAIPADAMPATQAVGTCMAGAIRRFQFPAPSDGQPVTVTYPIDLSTVATAGPPSARLSGFVLTRLHTRYGRDMPPDDLVFREAGAIQGGREVRGDDGQLEHGATSAQVNNFQARYAIRHAWTGAMRCDRPVRGRWGGPPDGRTSTPQAAVNTAFAQRGSTALASLVKTPVPELGIGEEPPPRAAPDASATTATRPTTPRRARGCGGCAVPSERADAWGAALAVVALCGWRWRRRSTSARVRA